MYEELDTMLPLGNAFMVGSSAGGNTIRILRPCQVLNRAQARNLGLVLLAMTLDLGADDLDKWYEQITTDLKSILNS